MKSSTNKEQGSIKSWMPMLMIGCVAVAAGIFASTLKVGKQEPTPSSHEELAAVQAQLQNSFLLPDDFKQVPAFSLLQGKNEPLTEADLKGKWSVLFFGFTNCPDICPITLAEINTAVAQLSEDAIQVPQILFITVDPVRDPVEKMAEYVAYFNKDFIGGSGDLADITALTRNLGIVASYTASGSDDKNYTVDHTASMLVIDPELRVRAKLNPPHRADTMAADLKILLTSFN